MSAEKRNIRVNKNNASTQQVGYCSDASFCNLSFPSSQKVGNVKYEINSESKANCITGSPQNPVFTAHFVFIVQIPLPFLPFVLRFSVF